ncbi:MAG: major capsid protein [Podoviridae sp. ctviO18]|nr:MAG: major capsid protein [Podoviridae sp. ctviO18]
MQEVFKRASILYEIASFEEQAQLKAGDTVHRPYRSSIKPQTYTRGTAVTIRDITDTDETLQVATAKVVPFYVDDLDELQTNYKTANEYADDASIELQNFIDGDVLGEYSNATSKVDDVEINGGTAGNAFVLGVGNVQKVFVQAKLKIRKQHIKWKKGQLFAAISPEFEGVLMDYLAGKESALGDSTGVAGHIGHYMGFDLYVSDSVGWSADLQMGSACTAGDTITINGVVLTAAASPTAAGEFDVEVSAAAQITTLVTSINAPGTSVSGEFVALSAANQDLLVGITATDGTTKISLKAEGWGTVVVSETLTAAADIWTLNKQIQHQLFGKKGAVDVVIQAKPKLVVKDVPDKLGKNFLPYTLYGLKTFTEGKKKLVDVRVQSDQFTASAS